MDPPLREPDLPRIRARVEAAHRSAHPNSPARRLQASLRFKDSLLTSGVCTPQTLAAARGTTVEETNGWMQAEQRQRRLLVVEVDGMSLIPTVQLDAQLALRPPITDVVTVLATAGVRPWFAWGWLMHPTGLLSGEVPSKLVETNLPRVLIAAHRFAASVGSDADRDDAG